MILPTDHHYDCQYLVDVSFIINKLKCCASKGKQASKIESTSLCCRSYSVLHVIAQKNEWLVFVE